MKNSLPTSRVLRFGVLAASAVLGVIVILLLNRFPIKAGNMSRVLADWNLETGVHHYLALQSFMWVAFFVGVGELTVRAFACIVEQREFSKDYLPGDESILYSSAKLTPIFKAVRQAPGGLILPRLIQGVIIQFRTSKSVSQSAALLGSNLELFLHEVDLRYNITRYIMWLIPTLGFIGTVVGIADGLDLASQEFHEKGSAIDLAAVISALAVAFYTTFLALIMSGVLVLLANIVQGAEEGLLNRAGRYCYERLISRLLEESAE